MLFRLLPVEALIRAEKARARGRRSEGVGVLMRKELKREVKASLILGGAGKGGIKGQGIGEAWEIKFSLESLVQSKAKLNQGF